MSKIEEFRSFMCEINVDAFMLHTKDEYFNEYSEKLTQLCGLTGTNGLLIVTKSNKCPFFTDVRYITQARNQLDQGSFQVYNTRRGSTRMGKSKLNIDHYLRLLFAIFYCKRDKKV